MNNLISKAPSIIKKNLFVTRRVPTEAYTILSKYFNVDIYEEDRTISTETLLDRSKGCEAIMTLSLDVLNKETILDPRFGQIKMISNYGVGLDKLDLVTATKQNILITNTPGVLTSATADLTFSLILALSKRVVESNKLMRKHSIYDQDQFDPQLESLECQSLEKKTLGLIGFGRIGFSVAKRAVSFGMDIIYHARNERKEQAKVVNATYCKTLDQLLINSDFVSIICPGTPQTKDMIGRNEFKLMKKTACLINTARGSIVNEEELISALQSDEIRAAAIDVYTKEPFVPHALRKLQNVILTPHIGSATRQARNDMGILAAQNLIDFFIKRKCPKHAVNKEVFNKI
ncbi:hypothetical protein M0813_20720 [Anaeramoeba flamelloides]|uniref:D-glycerate dehydrogenase n=1 Tax=Anaeramoeba flamelloides TaxID=1746091 RepID=A0ABQ8YK79_9EUKA|nr:hypothetical protein M0813_20720 [Anaeramoeba flamelloides]